MQSLYNTVKKINGRIKIIIFDAWSNLAFFVKKNSMSNIVAIVGKPNVGKSTLFNRLLEKKIAIIDDQPGVTRDRHYGLVEWTGRSFTVIDTGGYVTGSDDKFEKQIRKQVEIALSESNLVLFMVDCKTGITGQDEDFAKVIRASGKQVVLVPNKADNPDLLLAANEFYNLGLNAEMYPISSADGGGTGELLDAVLELLPVENDGDEESDLPRIAIMGRPNVGKSSFINALLGEERFIVTDEAGTTRDSIHSRYNLYGKDFMITDTAGVRKKGKVSENIEFYSVMRSIRAMEDSDVCIIVIDAERGMEAQDLNLLGLAQRYKKGAMIMVNKWDMIEKDNNTAREYEKLIKEKISPLDHIPVIFASVLNKQRIFKAIEMALEIFNEMKKRVSTSQLNEVMLSEVEAYPPPAIKGKYIKIKYITQLHSASPAFAFFCNLPQYIKAPYIRYLENKLRKHFGFAGVPIRIFMRKK